MASITIRNLDDDIKSRLRLQAAKNNRSMEEEARVILRSALSPQKTAENLADLALEFFGETNGVELETHPSVEPHEINLE